MLRRIAVLVSAATVLAIVGVCAPAGAADGAPTCAQFAGTSTISPGLTTSNEFQQIRATGTLSGCSGGGVTSGTFTSHVKGDTSCTPTPGQQIEGITIVHWDNGKTSVSKLTLTATANPTVVDVSSSVIGGLFRGDTFVSQLSFTPTNAGANCTSVPVTDVTFQNTQPLTLS